MTQQCFNSMFGGSCMVRAQRLEKQPSNRTFIFGANENTVDFVSKINGVS